MLSSKEKAKLRGIAQKRRALFQVGKDNVSENMIKTVDDSLLAHELIKVSMLKTCSLTPNEAAFDLAAGTKSEIVQIIGRTIVLYRRSKKNLMEM